MKGILKKKRISLAVLLVVLVLAVVFTFVARHLTGLKSAGICFLRPPVLSAARVRHAHTVGPLPA